MLLFEHLALVRAELWTMSLLLFCLKGALEALVLVKVNSYVYFIPDICISTDTYPLMCSLCCRRNEEANPCDTCQEHICHIGRDILSSTLKFIWCYRSIRERKVIHLQKGSLLTPPFLEVPLELDLCFFQQQLQVFNLSLKCFKTVKSAFVTDKRYYQHKT